MVPSREAASDVSASAGSSAQALGADLGLTHLHGVLRAQISV